MNKKNLFLLLLLISLSFFVMANDGCDNGGGDGGDRPTPILSGPVRFTPVPSPVPTKAWAPETPLAGEGYDGEGWKTATPSP